MADRETRTARRIIQVRPSTDRAIQEAYELSTKAHYRSEKDFILDGLAAAYGDVVTSYGPLRDVLDQEQRG